jgi:hypothetical protein
MTVLRLHARRMPETRSGATGVGSGPPDPCGPSAGDRSADPAWTAFASAQGAQWQQQTTEGAITQGLKVVTTVPWLGFLFAVLFVCTPRVADAQTEEENKHWLLGSPELNLEPTFSFDLSRPPPVEDVGTGAIRRPPSGSAFEMVLSLGVPTEIPRVGLALETIFVPSEIDNELEFEAELQLSLLTEDDTCGWLEAHFDVIDQVSPRERPGGSRAYTHKLNFELDIAFRPFNRLPTSSWLHHISTEVSFDYLATGLPRRGDVIDGERFLGDAGPWSMSVLISMPLAPLKR